MWDRNEWSMGEESLPTDGTVLSQHKAVDSPERNGACSKAPSKAEKRSNYDNGRTHITVWHRQIDRFDTTRLEPLFLSVQKCQPQIGAEETLVGKLSARTSDKDGKKTGRERAGPTLINASSPYHGKNERVRTNFKSHFHTNRGCSDHEPHHMHGVSC